MGTLSTKSTRFGVKKYYLYDKYFLRSINLAFHTFALSAALKSITRTINTFWKVLLVRLILFGKY